MKTISPFGYLLRLCVALVTPFAWANSSAEPEQLYPAITAEVLPELASRGQYPVGVRTLDVTNPAQFDPATQQQKDRSLTLEIWYPADGKASDQPTTYKDVTRSGLPFTLRANAVRDSQLIGDGKFPLVVLSHGYTGYRTIMFYLGEHLASHGYIVAAIDHTDSTNADVDFNNTASSGFFSTLLNRSRDQQFVLDFFTGQPHFASQQLDSSRAGLVGYSMGGYGAINTIGGCYAFTAQTTTAFTGVTDAEEVQQVQQLLNSCGGGQYETIKVDKRWKAMVAMAPWGGQHQLFNPEAMAKISTPTLYISGDLDDISGYEGIRNLYEQTGSASRYMLTFHNARHNIAPHPAPAAAYGSELDLGHYYEPSWSSRTLNEINKHFILAMLDCHVKANQKQCRYLDLPASGNQQMVEGKPADPWYGFDNRFSTGMSWQSSVEVNE